MISRDWNIGVPKSRGFFTNRDFEIEPDTKREDEKARNAKYAAMTPMDIKLKRIRQEQVFMHHQSKKEDQDAKVAERKTLYHNVKK